MNTLFEAPDLIYAYSRAQAVADGVLVDVTATAREAGFTVPVAMTCATWADCVEWTEETDRRKATDQDESGRLWDVVWMAHRAALRAAGPRSRSALQCGRCRHLQCFDCHDDPMEGQSHGREALQHRNRGRSDADAGWARRWPSECDEGGRGQGEGARRTGSSPDSWICYAGRVGYPVLIDSTTSAG